jgi:hypothetical protein
MHMPVQVLLPQWSLLPSATLIIAACRPLQAWVALKLHGEAVSRSALLTRRGFSNKPPKKVIVSVLSNCGSSTAAYHRERTMSTATGEVVGISALLDLSRR